MRLRRSSGDRLAGIEGDSDFVKAIHDALYCSKICSYAQGFQLMRDGAEGVSTGSCTSAISRRSGGAAASSGPRFLQKITEAYDGIPNWRTCCSIPYFRGEIERAQANWRKVIALAAEPACRRRPSSPRWPTTTRYRSERLPANLLQAQRDYFGAHTYERVDQPRGKFFHLDWPEKGRPQYAV